MAKKRAQSIKLLGHFAEVAELAVKLGGEVSFEWPAYCSGWVQKPLTDLIQKLGLFTARVDGCACGLRSSKGIPIKKPWRFITSSERLAVSLDSLRCPHPKGFVHDACQGQETKPTERYPVPLCRTILASLFGFHLHCPAMTCVQPSVSPVHREKDVCYHDHHISPFLSQESHA